MCPPRIQELVHSGLQEEVDCVGYSITDCGEELKFLFLYDCGEQLKFLFLSHCGEELLSVCV